MSRANGAVFHCAHCGAPLPGAKPGRTVRCPHCDAKQRVETPAAATDEGAEEERNEDPYVDDVAHDDDEPDSEDWLDEGQCLDVLRRHLGDEPERYEADEYRLEVDDEGTDEERVCIYVKDGDDEILDYFAVAREDGTLQIYDAEAEEWEDL
ncbi:MAG: hypothetical protein HY744_12240 [Deltaproteobacteria bacterium]|nr:hypothetical protein [Deltaproteobacteria bacterium]